MDMPDMPSEGIWRWERRVYPQKISKRRFSEFSGEAACNQEETGGLEQGLNDEPEAVVAERQPLVLQQPGVAALDRPAPLPQPRAARLAALVEAGLRPQRPAQPPGGARLRAPGGGN